MISGFRDIVGHASQLEVLQKAMRHGKVAHAYLFTGPPGVGKATVARAYAMALNCRELPDDACGQCTSCRKMATGNHPDFFEVVKKEDKTSIVIDQIRDTIKNTQFRPFEGRYKVFIIDGAESMTTEAANALLKTLEEPSAQTVFVLVTPVPHQLPPTVVSRCQTLRFGPIAEEEVRQWIERHLELEKEDASLVAALSDGSLGRAASLDLDFLKQARLDLFQHLAEAKVNDTAVVFDLAAQFWQTCTDPRDGLELLAGFLRDAVVWRVGGDPRRVRNRDALELIKRYAEPRSLETLLHKMRSLVYARRLVERNVNKSAMAEGLMLDLLSDHPTRFGEGRIPR